MKKDTLNINTHYDDVNNWHFFKGYIEIDKYIIALTSALITAHLFLFSSTSKPTDKNTGYFIIASFLFYLFSLLSTVWHKERFKLKKEIFLEGVKTIQNKWNQKYTDFHYEMVDSILTIRLVKHLPEILKDSKFKEDVDVHKLSHALLGAKIFKFSQPNDSSKDSKVTLKDALTENQMKVVVDTYISFRMNLEKEIEDHFDLVFNKPLRESCSRIKFYLDQISYNFRYYFFVGGILGTFISLVLNLI